MLKLKQIKVIKKELKKNEIIKFVYGIIQKEKGSARWFSCQR